MIRIIFVILAVTLSSAAKAQNANQYSCTVDDMTIFENDPVFVTRNLKKKFLITVGKENIYLTQTAEDFAPYQKVYIIIKRDMLGVFAADVSSSGLDTIAISEFYYDNTFSATLVTQATIMANVWKLDCQQQ